MDSSDVAPKPDFFALVGDSNVKRNVTQFNCRSCPDLGKAQVILCNRLELFPESLGKLEEKINVCILACITNFLTSSEEDDNVSKRIEPVLSSFISSIKKVAEKSPSIRFLVSPPMFRKSPLWYRDGLPEVLVKFSAFMSQCNNLLVLPSFATPEFEDNGVHLTSYSGLEYIYHLFDSSKSQLSFLTQAPESLLLKVAEDSRLLADRVVVLEQDHRRLNKDHEFKTAVDSEMSDYQTNKSFEEFFIVEGVPRLGDELTGKAWQEQAKACVSKIITEITGKTFDIHFVQNITGKSQKAIPRWQVKLFSAEASREIRSKFGSFFSKGSDTRPISLKDVSIRNRVTANTRVRIAVMKVLAKRYRDSNPESKASVSGYESRPMLRLTPPPSSKDRRVKVFNYIEAVTKLPTCFTSAELSSILPKIESGFSGSLRAVFICLSDDLIRPSFTRTGSNLTAIAPKRGQPDSGHEDDVDSAGFKTVRR